MKSKLSFLFVCLGLLVQAQNVTIPDANFKAYLVGNPEINTNGDSEIQLSEATAFTGWINCQNLGIADFTGLEAFVNITIFWCNLNQITSLDISNNTALQVLYANNNQLTSLDVSNNTALTSLNFSSNQLTDIDVSNNLALNILQCSNNQLTSLGVSNNTALTELLCYGNQLHSLNVANGNNTNFIIFSANNNPNLTCIEVDDAAYSATNWTGDYFVFDSQTGFSEDCCMINIPDPNFKAYLVGNSNINTNGDTEIQCSEATDFTGAIDCQNLGITDLTGIEAFINLTQLYFASNLITNIDVSQNTALIALSFKANQMMSLDISNNTALQLLQADNNQLTGLDISNNPALYFVNCSGNQLTGLDTSNNPALSTLLTGNNLLTSLDVSGNLVLTELSCNNNQLTSLNVANGNNTNFTSLTTTNNPNLNCIEVDDAAYSTANWTGDYFMFDSQTIFSENCALSINGFSENTVVMYPNPANDFVILNHLPDSSIIKIIDLSGKIIYSEYAANQVTVSTAGFANGIYIVQIENNGKKVYKKLVISRI